MLNLSLRLAHGKQENYGVPKPARPLMSEHPTVSQDLLNMAGRGLIRFKPNIDQFDMIMYATGYKVTFPFFREGFFNVEQTNDLKQSIEREMKTMRA